MFWLSAFSPSVATPRPQNKIRFLDYAQMAFTAWPVLNSSLFFFLSPTISSVAIRLNSWQLPEHARLLHTSAPFFTVFFTGLGSVLCWGLLGNIYLSFKTQIESSYSLFMCHPPSCTIGLTSLLFSTISYTFGDHFIRFASFHVSIFILDWKNCKAKSSVFFCPSTMLDTHQAFSKHLLNKRTSEAAE